jgi:Flp pilus assembly protein protease CpaA
VKKTAACAASAGASAVVLSAAGSGIDPLSVVRALVSGAALGAVAVYDLYERRIPNRLLLPATAACAAFTSVSAIPFGGAVTAAVVVAVLVSVALTKPEALCMGDAKLVLLIAVAYPARAAWAVMLGLGCAALAGVVVSLLRCEPIGLARVPLAPFLAAATVAVLL